WFRFVIVYLDFGRWMRRTFLGFGYALLVFILVMLVVNIFNGCFFSFDAEGTYREGPIRNLNFWFLTVLNILTAAFAFTKAMKNHDSARRKCIMVLVFCVTMTIAIIVQIFSPLWPFFALGCLIGSCFFHVFVIEDERAEMRRTAIEHEQTAKHMAELEKALERARTAEKSRSMFFSIVSHDIRTPLNAIIGYSELLKGGIAGKEERDEAIDSIFVSGTTLLELVNDVLDLAKMDAGKMTLRPEPVQLKQLTEDVFSSFRMATAGKGIELVNRTGGVPTVLLDGHRFRQILFNLVGNAVKFTDRGSITVAATYAGTNLEVAVSDTGCGIPHDMLTRILDPFVQVQDPSHSADRVGGTGLGLSICRSLIEVMGGELLVESELGKGSVFKVRIPGVATNDETAKTATKPKPDAALRKLPEHVLVIDDSSVNRSVLNAFLKKIGVPAIDLACDGKDALAKLDSAAKEGRPHDFILSDLWMPVMNGLEFIEKLRADPRFSGLPVFAVTADTEFDRDARTELFTGVLLKPMTYGKLVEVFARMER
ncbi:MAG: response regulator, partial [Lentisphaeria bacterium]|nr:response regulator [Lentisphaeria bacterium]